MMAFPRRSLVSAALVSAATTCFTLPATGQTVENFYKSHELTILIGHPPGGSYDLYAQLAAAHIGRFIPRPPTLIVQSTPGGAPAPAAPPFYTQDPLDRTRISPPPDNLAHVRPMVPNHGKRSG